ncbi:MAG TPA: hypothetical protein VFW25_02445 [Silvibacterium sp.]|nr:hypothetical protein [Silvibacterium sp.]
MTAERVSRYAALALSLAVICGTAGYAQQTESAAPPDAAPASADSVPAAAVPAKDIKPAPATPLDSKKIELGRAKIWQPEWDTIVENALPESLLTEQVPRDVRRFCPRFYGMTNVDKRAFWAYFFQALAAAEAGLNPTSHVRHTVSPEYATDEVTHLHVRCEGLLQLTYADEKRYGCNFDWDVDRELKAGDPARTILQPKNNLECGVKILTRQIVDNHEPLFSPRSYWATLEPGTRSFRVFVKQMTNPPLACGYRAHRRFLRRLAER